MLMALRTSGRLSVIQARPVGGFFVDQGVRHGEDQVSIPTATSLSPVGLHDGALLLVLRARSMSALIFAASSRMPSEPGVMRLAAPAEEGGAVGVVRPASSVRRSRMHDRELA